MQNVVTEITVERGSIFDSGADLLVCPVACSGALDELCEGFARRWPAAISFYKNECAAGRFSPGDIAFTDENGQKIAFAAVKELWAKDVTKEAVISVFEALTDALENQDGEATDIFSVAIPQIDGLSAQALEEIASETIGQSQIKIEVVLLKQKAPLGHG